MRYGVTAETVCPCFTHTKERLVTEILESVGAFFRANIWTPVSSMTWKDGLDILLLAVLFYFLYSFVSVRRAGKLLFGLATVVVLYVVTGWLDLRAAHWLLSAVASFGVIVLVVIFQPEIRDALDKLGSTVFDLRSGGRSGHAALTNTINEVVEAACQIAQQEKDGALIILEGSTRLGEFEKSGIALDARVSSSLLTNIFVDRSPLHDGAVIIRGDRIVAAGCKLPLSTTDKTGLRLGTRHRAALGITELSDCVVVVVSEERHVISVANNGCLKRDYNKSMADFATGEKEIQNRLRADLFLLMTGSADPTADTGSKDSDRHRKKYRVRSTPDAGDIPEVPADADEPDVQDGSENGGEDVTSRKA